jgi:hypothetical protein
MRKHNLLLIVLIALSVCLISCKRKIPITVYSSTGTVCYDINPVTYQATGKPLYISATIHWDDGQAAGGLTSSGQNARNTGYTVEVDEGAWVSTAGAGWCCCPHDADTTTLNYSYSTSFQVDTTGLFTKPHYYVVYYADGVSSYYE